MPYIATKDREVFDPIVKQLADAINAQAASYGYPGAFAGLFNYCVTTLALRVIPERRYWVTAIIKGIFSDLITEFTRRYQDPYEDEAIEKNGDVYPNAATGWKIE
jgi:hypothetical protein